MSVGRWLILARPKRDLRYAYYKFLSRETCYFSRVNVLRNNIRGNLSALRRCVTVSL